MTLPILVLLFAGVLLLGRGYTFAVAASDAARDGARYVAGKTATTNGPGIPNMCSLIKADLAAVTTTLSCATAIAHRPPFVKGVDYAAPTAGQALVLIYCGPPQGKSDPAGGSSLTCVGTPAYLQYHAEVDVYIYYGFNDLNLLGGLVTISGSSTTTTSW